MPKKPEPKIKRKSFINKPLYDKGEYNTHQWRKLRYLTLSNEPICRACKQREATVLDHIKPVRLGGEFWDVDNLQPLCKWCHNSKSGKESKM